ncbi:uncharacterized protein LOC125240636 [Leguminivora glycinivorella]|uniref:uncharacterized protein LOC125240636 n=1 Tax=Leguminivora glycinivorella TaxID=1035111 RepID=UPI002010A380|nr:uncharacterized protein LOC125240636 [Leguminivora glycinivorella]
MVSLKIQLLATIMFISKVYSQNCGCTCGGGSIQRCGSGSAAPTFVPGGQFVVPAVIVPKIPQCQTTAPKRQPSAASCTSAPCADEDDDELARLLYCLVCNMIESKKCSGRKQSSYDSCASASDGYDGSASGCGDDDDYCSYAPSLVYSCGAGAGAGGGDSCPEICVYVRQAPTSACADC